MTPPYIENCIARQIHEKWSPVEDKDSGKFCQHFTLYNDKKTCGFLESGGEVRGLFLEKGIITTNFQNIQWVP